MKKYTSLQHMQAEAKQTSRQLQILEESSLRLLMAYQGAVYDFTQFQATHPGGKGPLNTYKGRELEHILFNPSIHKHSVKVLQTMEKFKIGFIEEPKLTIQTTTMTVSKASTVANSVLNGQQSKGQIIKLTTSVISPASTTHQSQQQFQPQKVKRTTTTPHNEDLNQSFSSKLNQSMTMSQKFLLIPSQQELVRQQKEKQAKLMQEWQKSEIEEKRRQLELIKTDIEESRKIQSEIIIHKKPVNPYYQQWLNKQNQSQSQSTLDQLEKVRTNKQTSIDQIQQEPRKKVNPYYEQWKKQQQNRRQQQVITEMDESQLSSMNNSFQRSKNHR